MSVASPSSPPGVELPPVSARFVAAYTAAQIGAYIAFVPFLSLLLPLKAAAIAPTGKVELLAVVALWGAITAGIANVMAGAVADRSRWGKGERWRWIATGLLATVASYGFIAFANTPTTLLVAVVGLQISLNLMLNPLAVALPDLVPNNQKGVVSAYAGLAYPLASLFGAVVIGIFLTTEMTRLAAVVGTMLILVVPFILIVRRKRQASMTPTAVDRSWSALWDRDFQIAFLSRLLVQTAIAMNVLYLLFFLQSETRIEAVLPGQRPEAILGWVLAGSTFAAVLAGLLAGYGSDRIGRRREPVFAGGMLIAAGTLLMALAPAWPGPVVAQIVLGSGIGLYGVVDTALIAQILPSRANAGRDLGLMNIAATAAQVLAPLLALAALQVVGNDLRFLFGVSGVIAAIGATAILAIRRVR